MKKILLMTLSTLLLSGCVQVSSVPSAENTRMYNNEEFNISFQYPSNWEVKDGEIEKKLVNGEVISEERKFKHSVLLKTGSNEMIFFNYESMSFAEYENYKQPKEKEDDEKMGGFLIEEITLANYPAKKYTEYGLELAGISYIIEKKGRFLMFNTELDLNEEQKVGLEQILNSLEFK